MENNFSVNQQKFLEQMNGLTSLPANKTFIKNLETDEMRNGFLVTSHRKKLWNVQIGLINEFDRVCKKHNLRWFADSGTLLGAARHKGFIPWDDDVDLIMLRPDYNKFLEVAPTEISYPYFFDNWYDYTIESENIPAEKDLPKFQYITAEQQAKYPRRWFTQWPSFKLRDSRTTMIEFPDRKTIHQGIFIDVFVLDNVPPLPFAEQALHFEVIRELIIATAIPHVIRQALDANQPLAISRSDLEKFLKLPYRLRGKYTDEFAGKFFTDSEKFGCIRGFCGLGASFVNDSKNYDKTIYLPFEEIEVPAPVGWENCLTVLYGNWREMIFTHTHTQTYSADIPYTEYYRISKDMV